MASVIIAESGASCSKPISAAWHCDDGFDVPLSALPLHGKFLRLYIQNCRSKILYHTSESLDHVEATARSDELFDGDVKIEYHPKSGLGTIIQRYDEYFSQKDQKNSPLPLNNKPWLPFQTRLDFEVAALALECSLNRRQTNTLIGLLGHAQQGLDQCTIRNYDELQKIWDLAAEKSTQFITEQIEVPYREQNESFDISYRPLWDWIEEQLMDRRVVSQMEWHARRLYRFEKESGLWRHWIDEPWTAKRWWDIQDQLPDDGVPLCIIFYADKSKLSSFGTAKGYPVIARLANLPIEIRNSVGLGGGRVVGWYPIVKEDAERSGKTDFVDFKCIVWHESAAKILDSIVQIARTGYRAQCGDDVHRRMYPLIFLKAADYEEQYVDSPMHEFELIFCRCVMCFCPCPRCLIPKEELATYAMGHLRTAQHAIDVLAKADTALTKAEKEETVKEFGLRPILNVFFKIPLSDPYSTVSFDNLHFKFDGVWGNHLFPLLKAHIQSLTDGRMQAAKVDRRFQTFPRWSNVHHFADGVFKLSFNDGSKHRTISKIFLFAAYDTFHESSDKAGYQLLQILRWYLIVDMYSELHHQTDETIRAGRASVQRMFEGIKSLDSDIEKNWNFIKLHYHMHLFDDIEDKGILKGMSTMPNEKLHGPIRKIYLNHTNFKDIDNQIIRVEHQSVVAGLIQGQIDLLDANNMGPGVAMEEPEDIELPMSNSHFVIGSRMQVLSLGELECLGHPYTRFHIRLSKFISMLLPASGIPLPNQQYFKFTSHDMITPYQYLKIQYESLDTWQVEVDHLRCNPSFNGAPRHDFILFDSVNGPIFAQLCYIFMCTVGDGIYPIALTQPYKPVSLGRRQRSDKHLGFLRLQKEPDTEFISVRSIICGAVAITATESANEVLVWDVLDGDMFLRIAKHFPMYTLSTFT
ncbi:hypothetical protein GYMLUDRAFT_152168 [Collybiopsis luxurians FD-317 M1]|nr:hypothetical protein GYMLUDRAFT_152168 [Collybiopsis luxurians FD-317 M1]